MSKEEVIAAIQESAARLGHVPTFNEVRRTMKMSKHEIRKHFLTYAKALTELTQSIAELEAMGVQLKDFERGLVDFPSLRDGRVVLLCWQMGEGDELEWWHDVDAGFAGRTPL